MKKHIKILLLFIIKIIRRVTTQVKFCRVDKIGKDTIIGKGCRFINKKNIVIGKNVIIGRNVIIDCNQGHIIIGDNSTISDYTIIMTYGGKITLGENCSINPFSVIYGHGGLKIGNGVRIAAQTVIIPSSHNYEDTKTPIYQQGETSRGISIEDDVWIGSGARILDNLTISKGSIIAAGSVVNKTIPPFAIASGVPAKIINFRKEVE